jgi:KTSC domain-containing protein
LKFFANVLLPFLTLRRTYCHYCEIDQGTVDALLAADSIGRYFQANIRGSGSDGILLDRFGPRANPLAAHLQVIFVGVIILNRK